MSYENALNFIRSIKIQFLQPFLDLEAQLLEVQEMAALVNELTSQITALQQEKDKLIADQAQFKASLETDRKSMQAKVNILTSKFETKSREYDEMVSQKEARLAALNDLISEKEQMLQTMEAEANKLAEIKAEAAREMARLAEIKALIEGVMR